MDLTDPATFARVYDEHFRSAYGAAYRILGDAAQAQDVAQDVFVRLWRKPGAYDARRGPIGSYLRLVARSRALDVWRERQAAGRATDRLTAVVGRQEARAEERPHVMAERDGDRTTIRAALRDLPDDQREAVVLSYWFGLTADQIARRSNVPLGTAKSRIRLGLVKLRTALEADSVAGFAAAA